MDIDRDVLLAVKGLAEERGASAGRILSDLARSALAPKRKEAHRNGVPLFPVKADGKVVTLALVNRLRDEHP